jgi:hypothetical protein
LVRDQHGQCGGSGREPVEFIVITLNKRAHLSDMSQKRRFGDTLS